MKLRSFILYIFFLLPACLMAQGRIEGKVLMTDGPEEKDTVSLPGASVIWLGTTIGTSTNAAGYFELRKIRNNKKLIVSFVGFRPDTVTINDDDKYIEVFLNEDNVINEITVTGRTAGTFIDRSSPAFTYKITSLELTRAACCNLSESFETNAAVDVNYSDAATGAKQIQLLGLAGTYVQILTENIPAMYGLGAAYGLSYIPGPWMESIQVSKGTSSVRNGNESITGQINVEYKKPATSERVFVNGFASDAGKFESNANASVKINKYWSTMLFAHGETQSSAKDHNNDGFRDEPDVRQYSFFNRWDYLSPGLTFRSGIKYMKEQRIGGQFSYDRSDATTYGNGYGINIGTERAEAFTKLGVIFGTADNMSIGWIQSFTYHNMSSWMGYNMYDATQKSYYANLLYQYVPAVKHTIDAGISYRYDNYNETRAAYSNPGDVAVIDPWHETIESVPGVFMQYTYTDSAKVTLLAGMRYDFYSNHGAQFTPRIHMRYVIVPKLTLRVSAGKGFRTVHVMAENMYYLASSRKIVIAPDLDIEEAWNAGINLTGYIPIGYRELRLSGEAYRTSFIKQIVTDMDASVDEVRFYNLDGESWSNVFQVEAQIQPFDGFDITAAWRWNDVRQTIDGVLREKPLSSRYKGLLTASYTTRLRKWQFDYTLQYNGPGRLPSTVENPEPYRRQDSFTAYPVMNAQITRSFKRWNIYLGAENLTDFKQHDPIIASEDPFGEYFDATMIWGPVHGRKIYGGFRYAINRPQN